MDDYNKQFVALMQESGWIPEDVVRELGITKGAVSQYRSGRTRPSITVLRLFSAKTNLPLALLPGEPAPTSHSAEQISEQEREFIRKVRNVDSSKRHKVLRIVGELLDVVCQSPVNSAIRAKMEDLANAQTAKDLEEIVQKREKSGPPLPPSTPARRNTGKG